MENAIDSIVKNESQLAGCMAARARRMGEEVQVIIFFQGTVPLVGFICALTSDRPCRQLAGLCEVKLKLYEV
jgi:hypothetical protein